MRRRLLPETLSSEAQERVDTRPQFCVSVRRICVRAIGRVLVVILACLVVPLNGAAEPPARKEPEPLRVNSGVNRVEVSASHQPRMNGLGGFVDFFSPVSTNGEPMTEQCANEQTQGAGNGGACREHLRHQLVKRLQFLMVLLFFAIGLAIGSAR